MIPLIMQSPHLAVVCIIDNLHRIAAGGAVDVLGLQGLLPLSVDKGEGHAVQLPHGSQDWHREGVVMVPKQVREVGAKQDDSCSFVRVVMDPGLQHNAPKAVACHVHQPREALREDSIDIVFMLGTRRCRCLVHAVPNSTSNFQGVREVTKPAIGDSF